MKISAHGWSISSRCCGAAALPQIRCCRIRWDDDAPAGLPRLPRARVNAPTLLRELELEPPDLRQMTGLVIDLVGIGKFEVVKQRGRRREIWPGVPRPFGEL